MSDKHPNLNLRAPLFVDATAPRSLTCPAPGCRNLIPGSVIMCIRHWAMLPPHIQRTLAAFTALDQRDDTKYRGAMEEAMGGIAWLEKNKGRV